MHTECEKKTNWLRQLYAWTVSWAERPQGLAALFGLSFIETIIFPIPPDPLLIALCLTKPKQWAKFAFWCMAASVLGAVCAWWIGMSLWGMVGDFFFHYIPGFTPVLFEKVRRLYDHYAFWAVVSGSLVFHPFKVFTIASGVFKVNLPVFIMAAIVGRSIRFFGVAGVIRVFGPGITPYLEKYMEWVAIVAFVLGILGFVAISWIKF